MGQIHEGPPHIEVPSGTSQEKLVIDELLCNANNDNNRTWKLQCQLSQVPRCEHTPTRVYGEPEHCSVLDSARISLIK